MAIQRVLAEKRSVCGRLEDDVGCGECSIALGAYEDNCDLGRHDGMLLRSNWWARAEGRVDELQ